MKFLRNMTVYARKTPLKAWIFAIVIPGGFIGMALWLSTKSAYRIFKKRHDKITIGK